MATLNNHVAPTSPTHEVNVQGRQMLGNVLELVELQTQLLLCDVQAAKRNAIPGLITAGIALVIGLAGLPVLLFGVAELIADTTGWSHSMTLIIVGVIVSAIAAISGYVSMYRIRQSLASFQRSQTELKANLGWLKCMVQNNS